MRNRIDEIDAKILKTLLKDTRTSFTEIAKNCKISVSAVRARYKRLWKMGVINGEIMQVNPYSLGYKYVCTIGVITAIENESKARDFLKGRYHTSIMGALGKFNIFILVALHDIQELNKIQEELEANPLIKHVDALIWVEALRTDHPENLVIKPFTGKNEQKATQRPAAINCKEARIDETDRKIAKILSRKSRTPFRKIAEQLNISTKNVIQRYRRLRGSVLTGSTITVNLNNLGFKAQADLLIKVANRSKIPEIHAQLLQIPNLILTVKIIGPYDLLAAAVFTDFEEVFKMKDSIRRIQDIENLDMFLRPPFHSWPWSLFDDLL